MYADDIECLSDKHFFYMGIAAIALLIYYPISTFMFPNFQFQNKVLDLKYDPSYVVVLIQGKLIITGNISIPFYASVSIVIGFISFFKPHDVNDTNTLMAQLLGVSVVLFLIAFVCSTFKPCLIKRANVWDTCAYCIAGWVIRFYLVALYIYRLIYADLWLF